jgi:hypothetical protein
MRPASGFLTWASTALVLVACASSTGLVAKWKDPTVTNIRFQKVLALAVTKDATLRRAIEDELVRQIPRAIPSYSVLSDEELRDVAAAKAKVKAAGFDGAAVFRVVSAEQQTTYVPGTVWYTGPSYGSFWGYYDMGWGAVYDPGYLQTDQIVTVETLVYSLEQDKLVWAARSQTMNPGSVQTLVKDVVDAVAKEMKAEQLI